MTREEALRILNGEKPVEKPRRPAVQREHHLQTACVQWARLQFPKLTIFAIPNGAWCGYKQGRKLVAEGLLKGVPDIFVALARKNYHGLFIEMKAGKKGVVREEQTEMLTKLRQEGYCCAVCRTFEQFQQIIIEYMS
ncbi:MAG: VRR-NUC domain-containing protein [Paludibacteraceae bacterium]|nr:VRR-NUC domain-containing protein [Paludibacteraceae bacterium]